MLDAFSFNLQVPLYPFPPVTYTFKNQDLLTCVLNTRTLLSAFSGCSLPHFFVPYISHELAAGGGLIISLRFHLFGSTAGDGEHFVWFCFFCDVDSAMSVNSYGICKSSDNLGLSFCGYIFPGINFKETSPQSTDW